MNKNAAVALIKRYVFVCHEARVFGTEGHMCKTKNTHDTTTKTYLFISASAAVYPSVQYKKAIGFSSSSGYGVMSFMA
jgi:hypothetical protein